jgi:hypothetical protein
VQEVAALERLYDIVTVRHHRRTRDGIEAVFWNGFRGFLADDTPDFDYFEFLIRQAKEVVQKGEPAWAIGLEVQPPDRILIVGHANNSAVMGMGPGEEIGDWEPRLAGHPFALYLKADHPDYARITRTLQNAFESGGWVWYALFDRRGHDRILDVRLFEKVLLHGGVSVRPVPWRR